MSDLFTSDPAEAQRYIQLLERRLAQYERHHIKSEKWFKLYHEINEYLVYADDGNGMELLFEAFYEIDGGVYDSNLGQLTPKQGEK